MKECEQSKLFRLIQNASFAMDDVRLYLDTHVDDMSAVTYYEAYRKVRERLVKQYTKYYKPLIYYSVRKEQQKSWYEDPWPWEGEEQ